MRCGREEGKGRPAGAVAASHVGLAVTHPTTLRPASPGAFGCSRDSRRQAPRWPNPLNPSAANNESLFFAPLAFDPHRVLEHL